MKKLLIPAAILLAAAAIYWWGFRDTSPTAEPMLLTTVQEGSLDIFVTATGELQAMRSEKIMGPDGMRAARIYQVAIADLVPEGTIVAAGDYVARLDKSELDGRIKDISSEIEQKEAQLTQAKIDTAITLRGARDQLVNLKYNMEEKALEVEQSKYEPPAVIRRVELDLERIKRDYQQQQTNYELKKRQAEAKVQEIRSGLEQTQLRLTQMLDLAQEFTIVAPKPGMVIYERSWNGKKGPGSRISSWDPIVARLPDLSTMVSKTYVNEVDINKVKRDQAVTVRADAFPERTFKGRVVEIANIGEQMQKFDAKVFEVVIELLETDTFLRPAMTTSNQIVTRTYDKVKYLPLEAIHNDSLTYVFTRNEGGRWTRQEVHTGDFNESYVIVSYGLAAGQEVALTAPDDAEELPFVPLSEADRKAMAADEAAYQAKLKAQAAAAKAVQQAQATQEAHSPKGQ